MTRNFLTFDIEEWYHANYASMEGKGCRQEDGSLERNVERLLSACASFNIRTTCFVLGSVAEKKPQLVRKIHAAGHEIASHGQSHRLVYRMSPEEFRKDTERAKKRLEDLTGQPVAGFRAACWSVSRSILPWYYETLESLGFCYSSSVFPVKNFLYGIPDFPAYPHVPRLAGQGTRIIEIPGSVIRLMGQPIGYSGGFYLRLFPSWWIIQAMRNKNRLGIPVFVYLHPREVDPAQQRLRLGLRAGFIHYHNIRSTERKLKALMARFSFSTMREYCEGFRDPHVSS